MARISVEEVLASLKVSDPKEVTINDKRKGTPSAAAEVALSNSQTQAEAIQRGDYLAKAGALAIQIDREIAMQLRQRGARYVGKRQDPWPEQS